MKKTCVKCRVGSFLTLKTPKSHLLCKKLAESLVVAEDNIKYREKGSTDKKVMRCLSVAGSKKTPLCYSKFNKLLWMKQHHTNKLYFSCMVTSPINRMIYIFCSNLMRTIVQILISFWHGKNILTIHILLYWINIKYVSNTCLLCRMYWSVLSCTGCRL